MTNKSTTRLFVVLARQAPVGVIFRRGPSKQVQLIKWDTSKDHFEYGQWFKGRIYEHRCDLSPSGEKLIYLAANWKKLDLGSWTAVSKPPYLTALALWPNLGAWGGGGLFEHENTVCLNHRFDMGYDKLAEGFELPQNINVKPLGKLSGHGEDDPIRHEHLIRDGWKFIDAGKRTEHPYDPSSKIWITYDPPITYQKTHNGYVLTMQIKGFHEWGGSHDVTEYLMSKAHDKDLVNLGRMDWADWDAKDDLLFARSGKLYRYKMQNSAFDLNKVVELADFNDLKFEEKVAPPEFLKW